MANEVFLSEEEIENLRKPWEIGDHWELRREFLLAHRDSFPRDRLLSLAQMFVNIETLQTTYDAEMMSMVSSLAQQVPFLTSFREKKAVLGGTKFKAPEKSSITIPESYGRGRGRSNFNSRPQGYRGSYDRSNYSPSGPSYSSPDSTPSHSPHSSPSYRGHRRHRHSYGSDGQNTGTDRYSSHNYQQTSSARAQPESWTAGNSTLASYETVSYQTSSDHSQK